MADEFVRKQGSLFLFRGMTTAIPDFSVRMLPDGRMDCKMSISCALDLCPFWLGIVLDHLASAERIHAEVVEAWRSPDDERLGRALEEEFVACMQCIMASAIAMDAFYSTVKNHVKLPSSLLYAWRQNGLPRHRQIAEILKLGFRTSHDGAKRLRAFLKDLFRFRDLAVHPPSELSAPLLHPELQLVMEWRFVYFRFANAKAFSQNSLGVLAHLADAPKSQFPTLAQYCKDSNIQLKRHVDTWESRYGKLYQGKTADTKQSE